MKKTLIIILCMSMLLTLLFSCSDAKGTDSAQTTEKNPEQIAEQAPVALSIGGNDISGYTIVYADSLYDKKIRASFSTEHDFFRLIAKDISERIFAQTGIELPIARDSATDESELEILVGPTNRALSDPLDTLDIFKTYVKTSGSKLVVGAGYNSTPYTGNLRESYCYASTFHAFDALDACINDTREQGMTSLDLSDGSDFSTTVDLITVACIGDSITEGAGSSKRDFQAYPAVLGRILWKDHLIVNLGNSGKTMRDDLDRHYRGTTQHAAMRRYGSMYDYAFVMLGTNDSYFDRTWPSSADQKYLTSADSLVSDLAKNNDKIKVVVMNCPMYYGTNGSGSARVRALQSQLPARFEEMGVSAAFFDMYTFTKEEVGRENFPDELHPNETGYELIAQKLSQVLSELEAGTYTYELP